MPIGEPSRLIMSTWSANDAAFRASPICDALRQEASAPCGNICGLFSRDECWNYLKKDRICVRLKSDAFGGRAPRQPSRLLAQSGRTAAAATRQDATSLAPFYDDASDCIRRRRSRFSTALSVID
jgi:hypothetical protein